MIPVYPAIFRRFEADLRDLDIVIVDSSAWAHHVPVATSHRAALLLPQPSALSLW